MTDPGACRTLGELAEKTLTAAAMALGMTAELPPVVELLRRICGEWASRPLDAPPAWPSGVVDDGTPFELSVAFAGAHGVPELRFIVEPFDPSRGAAALALLDQLPGVDHERLSRVRDLFVPERRAGRFAVWLAASVRRGGRPELKAYFDPHAHGRWAAPAVVEEALVRLGHGAAWPRISRHLLARGPALDELVYASIDLARSDTARVKIYARHVDATAGDLEHAASAAPSHQRGDVARFVRTVTGRGEDRVFDSRCVHTCLALSSREPAVTTHVPINGYAAHDAEIRDRVGGLLGELGIAAGDYHAVLDAVASRPLDRGLGIQSYVSFRRESGAPRVTVYLPIEAYAPGTVAMPARAEAPRGAQALADHYEGAEALTRHPLVQRMRREPASLANQYVFLANFQVAISKHFAGNLARITARVDDDRLRCILARQLSDELGNGVWANAHVNLFAHMMQALEPHRPTWLDDAALEPGRAFYRNLQTLYDEPDPAVGVAAVVLGEIFGKQLDLVVGEELRRGGADVSALPWLTLHESLELEHAAEVHDLAALLPAGKLDTLRRGMAHGAQAGWMFLDDLYAVIYGRAA